MSDTNHRQAAAALILLLVMALLAIAIPADGAAPESPADNWDSSCGQVFNAFDPADHTILVPRADGVVSCWEEDNVRMWEIRQPGMAGGDPSKPAFGIFFPVPQAQSCQWWGWQASLWDDQGVNLAPRYSPEGLDLGVNAERYSATVDDPFGGSGAGFLLVCSGVTGDIEPTPTPGTPASTATPTMTPPPPTATPTPSPTPVGIYRLEQSGTAVEVIFEGPGEPFMEETSIIYSTWEFPSVLVYEEETPCWTSSFCGWHWTPAAPVQASGGLLWGVKVPDTRYPLQTTLAGWRVDGKWFLRGSVPNPDMIPRAYLPSVQKAGSPVQTPDSLLSRP